MRIQTKEQRTQIRTAQFNRLIAAGYIREDYKTLQIFTNTAMNYFYRYLRAQAPTR
jgi:hypothetical protein